MWMRRRSTPKRTTWSFRFSRPAPAFSDVRPAERFGNSFRSLAGNPILSFQASMSRKPFVCGCVHEPIAFDHFLPRFGEGRHAELHPSGHGSAVPGGAMAAAVLLPDSQPGKIGTLPNVAERKPELRRKCNEMGVFALRICTMSRESACRSGAFHLTQIGHSAVQARSHRPG